MDRERILIYIANPIVSDVTAFRLDLIGMEVVAVRSEQAFSQSLKESLPDAVIVDLDLQSGEGMRLIEQLASDECTSHLPVMCVSSRGDLTEAEAAYKAGVRGLLVAPYDPLVLESKLRHLLDEAMAAKASGEEF